MVVSESELASQGEVESPLQTTDQQLSKSNNSQVAPIGGQSSIYSLTLDEFQNTLCENGKNFGSMNMDEFLTSIWNAEENQQTINLSTAASSRDTMNNQQQVANSSLGQTSRGIATQPSLPRQGSFSLPAPLCRKTVDEVWSEIQRGHHASQHVGNNSSSSNNVQNSDSAARQGTFGEMTLEDFLVKAGVVRDIEQPQVTITPQLLQQYGMYQNNVNNAGPSFVARPMIGMPGGNSAGCVPAFQAGQPSGYARDGQRNGGYVPPQGVCYGARVGNTAGIGAYGPPGQAIGLPAPMSPVSSDGICASHIDNSMSQFGMDMGGSRGRKRIVDGPVEKVVERRQRRMIKNRESAARSRARKQAYTVELEAELNQLREENAQLKQAVAEMERKRKQEEVRLRAQAKSEKGKDKTKVKKRSSSCPPFRQ